MAKLSRRELAENITTQLINGADSTAVMKQLAAYMITAKMTAQADLIMNDIAASLQRQTGHSRVVVTTAHFLTPASRKEIEAYLMKSLGLKSVEIDSREDTSLIGGMQVQTPEYELDTSIKTKLQKLANRSK